MCSLLIKLHSKKRASEGEQMESCIQRQTLVILSSQEKDFLKGILLKDGGGYVKV